MPSEVAAGPVAAEIAALLAEERSLQLSCFDADAVWVLGAAISHEIVCRRLPAAVDISRGADTVFFFAGEGATPDNTHWIRRKRATVLRFHHSSLLVGRMAEEGGYAFHARFRVPEADFAAAGGGVPLIVAQAGLVGVVTISGLPSLEDHRLATRHLAGLIAGRA